MTGPDTPVAHETLFVRLTVAFGQKDNATILAAMTPDVEIEVPGGSPLAGCHQGADAVGRFVPAERPIEFGHDGNEMMMSQTLRAETTEWTHRYRITFADSGRIERIVFEPPDIDSFDLLVDRAFAAPDRPPV
jgi:hypothetical protein